MIKKTNLENQLIGYSVGSVSWFWDVRKSSNSPMASVSVSLVYLCGFLYKTLCFLFFGVFLLYFQKNGDIIKCVKNKSFAFGHKKQEISVKVQQS